ncbi:MAG: RagB/SusD family nutrient uptake outer membrane protein, partial [Butyricimonas paravirosa]
MRGWYYFLLVNLFGLPYNYGDPTENMGVPLKLKMEITGSYYRRNSVAEVYEQIEKDLLDGINLLENNPIVMSEYKINALAAKSILSRVYLYMENWDGVLRYTNEVLAEKSGLTALASADEAAFAWQGSN